MSGKTYYSACPKCGNAATAHGNAHAVHSGMHAVMHGAKHISNPWFAALAAVGAAVAGIQAIKGFRFHCSNCNHVFYRAH